MTKTALALILTLAALPAAAQTSEFGFLLGGVNARLSTDDRDAGLKGGSWKFGASVKEIYYSVQLEPGTRFRIKAGAADTTTSFVIKDVGRRAFDGRLEHVEGVLDYRFAEAFGSTGIFAGIGLYRQKGGNNEETDYGASLGVNADFPLSPRYGVVVEGTYHYTRFETRPAYLTATVGLRIKF
jgi:hypothetical protein